MFAPPLPTTPGIEINVTPDSEAPTIPKATKYQGDLRPAIKKFSLPESLPVKYETTISSRKYNTTTITIKVGDKPFIIFTFIKSRYDAPNLVFLYAKDEENHKNPYSHLFNPPANGAYPSRWGSLVIILYYCEWKEVFFYEKKDSANRFS